MATKARKPRGERTKQGHLKGLEPLSIPAIDEAAEAYRDTRNARMEMLETETELQQTLLSKMTENKIKTYKYEADGVSRTVNVTDLQKVAVRKEKAESNGEAE